VSRHWVAVASADHVAIGRGAGFMQVCHGKAGPLQRLREGDVVAYYSPSQRMGEGRPLQAFTAIGIVGADAPVQADMGGGFMPWRRQVAFLASAPAPIRPLLERLSFTRGRERWGASFRYGLFEVPEADMRCIADAMQAPLAA